MIQIVIDESLFAVKLGTPVCILGDLVFDKKYQKIYLTNIKYLSSNWNELISNHKQSVMAKYLAYGGAMLLAAYFSFKVVQKAYSIFRSINDIDYRQNHQEEIQERRRQLLAMFTDNNRRHPRIKGLHCHICKVSSKDCINHPCQHVTHCRDCMDRLPAANRQCLDCGQRIQRYQVFYFN